MALQSPVETPTAIRKSIEAQGAMADAEAATAPDGTIYLFAENLANRERAEYVLLTHEVTHAGLTALLGDKTAQTMRAIYNSNGQIARQADAVAKKRGLTREAATEEVLADMSQAELPALKGWRKLVEHAQKWLADAGFQAISRQLRAWLDGNLSAQQRADAMVAELVAAARGAAAGRKSVVTRLRDGDGGGRGSTAGAKLSRHDAGMATSHVAGQDQGGTQAGDNQGRPQKPYLLNDQGGPLVLYHGTQADFEHSDLDRDARNVDGIWFLPSFSRSDELTPPRVEARDEVAVVDRINREIASIGASVTLAATFDELPKNVKDAAAASGVEPAEFRGVTMGSGQVFVVHENHSGVADLEATIVHEVYGHVGLRALFGPDLYRRLNKLYLGLGEAEVAALAKKYGLTDSYFKMAESMSASPRVTRAAGGVSELRNGWISEELLAHIAERETGIIARRARELVGAIRSWLREHGFAKLGDMGMSDVAHILKRGRLALSTQSDFTGVEDQPAFKAGSRFSLPEETGFQRVRRRAQDYFLRALVTQDAVASRSGTLDEQTNFYLAEELSHGRRGALMEDFAKRTVKPMMERAVKLGVDTRPFITRHCST